MRSRVVDEHERRGGMTVIGPWVNGGAIAFGALGGALLSTRMPERLRIAMPLTFGAASMAMGVVLLQKVAHMPVMVLSALVGSLVGELIHLEQGLGRIGGAAQRVAARFSGAGTDLAQEEFLREYVSLMVLFSVSGTGIFGAMNEGMTGDASILIAKAFLDFFTAGIFATGLGLSVGALFVPQTAIQLALAYGAVRIMPLTTPAMIGDFSAVGGLVLLATGLRISGIKVFPVANMIPAMILAMPISALWTRFF
jgi:uncharacterized membrane protein YqgA involved in biofilm formation